MRVDNAPTIPIVATEARFYIKRKVSQSLIQGIVHGLSRNTYKKFEAHLHEVNHTTSSKKVLENSNLEGKGMLPKWSQWGKSWLCERAAHLITSRVPIERQCTSLSAGDSFACFPSHRQSYRFLARLSSLVLSPIICNAAFACPVAFPCIISVTMELKTLEKTNHNACSKLLSEISVYRSKESASVNLDGMFTYGPVDSIKWLLGD